MKITLDTLPTIIFELKPGDRIFLKGNLWAGKTTFSQALIKKFLRDDAVQVTSPTYTYYQTYPNNLYHFDLYRVSAVEDIDRIGAREIFDDPESICIIEWPEILDGVVKPTKIITMTYQEDWREVSIMDCQAL
jgi:tRNA threonylcarbamoyladenosine biosynthesis protein TsaE